jgi:hypothetical protein
MGVVRDVAGDVDSAWRKGLLRQIDYTLSRPLPYLQSAIG